MKKLFLISFLFISTLSFGQVRMDIKGALEMDSVPPVEISEIIDRINSHISDTIYSARVDNPTFMEGMTLIISTKKEGVFHIILKYQESNEAILKKSLQIPEGSHDIEFNFGDNQSGTYILFIWMQDSEYYLTFNLYKI